MEDVREGRHGTLANFVPCARSGYIEKLLDGTSGPPMPRRAPTFPRTCSAQRCASWFFWISWYAASALSRAALAVAVAVAVACEMMPPHPPHPQPLPACLGSGGGFAGSSSVGAKLWWNERALSPDLRGAGGWALSSLVRVEPLEDGVATPALRALLDVVDDDDSFGVLGRLIGRGNSGLGSFSRASSSSSSFKASSSSCSAPFRGALAALELFGGGAAGASASISSSASCSSSVLEAMVNERSVTRIQYKRQKKGTTPRGENNGSCGESEKVGRSSC
jgi:hypothetical protein